MSRVQLTVHIFWYTIIIHSMHVIQPSKTTLTEEEIHKQGDVLLQDTVCHPGLTVVGHQGNKPGILSVWCAKSRTLSSRTLAQFSYPRSRFGVAFAIFHVRQKVVDSRAQIREVICEFKVLTHGIYFLDVNSQFEFLSDRG